MVLFRESHGAWQKLAQPHFTPDSEDVIPIPAASIYRERSFSSVRSLYNNLKMGNSWLDNEHFRHQIIQISLTVALFFS